MPSSFSPNRQSTRLRSSFFFQILLFPLRGLKLLLLHAMFPQLLNATVDFPIGIFNVSAPADLSQLHAAGFNAAMADSPTRQGYEPLAQEARRLGMSLMFPCEILLEGRHRTRDWPVLAWYLDDEPEVNGHGPDWLGRRSDAVRRLDSRPRAFSIGNGAAAERFSPHGDVLLLDWYPVPHLPLDSVADELDRARTHWPSKKPVWMIVQAFDWREEIQRDPTIPRIGRFPNEDEIRFMSYLAIIHGASGIFYFRLSRPGGETLLDSPDLWRRIARTTLELADLGPRINGGEPRRMPFRSSHVKLEGRSFAFRGHQYVILANRTAGEIPIPPELRSGRWTELYSDKAGHSTLLPFDVAIYRHAFRFKDL